MCGNYFQESELLFAHIFENSMNNWLWFHLKLASFQFSEEKSTSVVVSLNNDRSLPANYKAYFLEDLVKDVTSEDWQLRHRVASLDDATNRIKFSKVLFYVGEFMYGILELLKA